MLPFIPMEHVQTSFSALNDSSYLLALINLMDYVQYIWLTSCV